MNDLILKLDVTGHPLTWISREEGAVLYCKDRIAWEAGERHFELRGGFSRATGHRSVLRLATIVAATGTHRRTADAVDVPHLTNARLFRRDGHVCLYCGERFGTRYLTRDHVQPMSRGGLDVWENVVTACRPCNQRKDARTLDELAGRGMRLLAIPYAPNRAEGLILANRRILADQMAFLKARISRASRLDRRIGN